ncbi:hypothetical protein DO97_15785 [Neosynechococcus sphagnicola sy1]|uniref:General secretion pathway protein GspH n=1 Tax=Neosynechococcus sphagnicola sy1 TaxID=1497020 RepID=A0A098TI82_9CYAN|nr:hypothetical protein DO97_15785 [Neosynechococcus sphagnicola sy1]
MEKMLLTGLMGGLTFGVTLLGFSGMAAQAQSQVTQNQNAALNAIAKMMEGQRTYYAKNGQWLNVVSNVQKDFDAVLPPTFDYAIRTTTEAAYSYVIPATSPLINQLSSYVGAALLVPNSKVLIITIICKNNQPGQIRPSDPQIVRGADPTQPPLYLACGDNSVEIPASIYTEK